MDHQQPSAPTRPEGVRGAFRTFRMAIDLVAGAARREMAITLALTIVGAVLTAGELLVGRQLVELLTGDNAADTSASDIMPWLLALGGLLIGTALVSTSLAELRILLNELVGRRATDQLLEAATTAELEAFDNPEFHDQIQRARAHSDSYAWQVVSGLVTLLSTGFTALAVIVVLLSIAPLLVPIAVLAYVPIAAVGIRNSKALYELHYGLAEGDRDRMYHVRLLTGRLEAKEVRAFGLTEWLRRRHDTLFAERIENTRRVVARRTVLALIGSAITALAIVATLGFTFFLAIDDRISVADAAVAIVALQQLSGRLRGMGDAATSMVEGVTFLRDFETLRLLVPPRSAVADAADEVASLTPPPRPTEIAVDRVSYRYPAGEGDALVDVSLRLRSGQVVAVVGPNGAGKSTLAKLLCGLLAPDSGAIRWDDVDTAHCEPQAVRALVAPVFQDFTRYEHTAGQAIGFGDLARMDDEEAIGVAAKQAGVADFVADLPAGYETRLSTSFAGGTELSVGQWQRMAIARAFFRDAPLVVMDEPAASLDPRAERDLFERLHHLGTDRTVLFISHRFATVHRADHIVVLLEGRVAEQGTHEQLMELGAVYAELYTLQAQQFG